MKKKIITTLILLTTLSACGQNITPAPVIKSPTFTSLPVKLLPSSTTTPKLENTETPWPTLVYPLYITATPDPLKTSLPPQPTITAPPSRNPPLSLPFGLDIEEYQITEKDVYLIETQVLGRHHNRGGWYYWPKGGIINGKLFQAEEAPVNNHAGIRVTLDNNKIASVDCNNTTTFPTVVTAWAYDQHWIIQSVCHQKFDVLWDGVSLNTSKEYQSSFAFQILGQHPFYLFKRNDQIWLSYDGQEVLLGYKEVKLTYCCMSYHPPQHYERLITFYATQKNQLYYVAIGLFDE